MGLLTTIGSASARAFGLTRAAIKDAFFNLTTLLLHGNGTNGAQNNTFLDSSSNNYTITRNGNATQGTFSPFSRPSGEWGYFFTGFTGLRTPNSSITNIIGTNGLTSSSAFFAECWVYVTEYTTGNLWGDMAPNAGTRNFSLVITTAGKLEFGWFDGASKAATGNTTISLNTWTNVAVTVSGTSIYLFVNGVLQTLTGTTTLTFPSGTLGYIGFGCWNNGGSNLGYRGYISNLRIIKSAVYTSGYTVTTSPYTNITNTGLLVFQSNTLIDNSSNAYVLTSPNNQGSVATFTPFLPSATYNTSSVGGSVYFDGTGDYLSVSDNANLRFGTSAFTIQAWVYRSAIGIAHSIIAKGGATTGFVLQITTANIVRFTHGSTNVDTTTTLALGSWYHIAAVRTGTGTNGFQLYINGVSSATATVATDFNQTDTLYVGADRSAANVMNGYISGLKYTNGTAESISVPTSPPTATTNVALLCNFTNVGVLDNTAKFVLETVGNAQISTAISKFGGSSLSFDGTGDYLFVAEPNNSNNEVKVGQTREQYFNTSPFTIEMWVYRNSSGTYGLVAKGTATTGWLVSLNSSNQVVFTFASSTITSSGTVAATTWTHIAVVREGTGTNQTKIYISGSNDGTGTVSTNFTQVSPLYVGANRTGGDNFNGYIDDLRITRVARYTANFTPPVAPFPDQ